MRVETRESHNSKQLVKTEDLSKNTYFSKDNSKLDLKSTYFYYEDKFKVYLTNKGLSQGYIKDVLKYSKGIISKVSSIKELINEYETKPTKYYYLAIRNWVNFCEDQEILVEKEINLIRKRVKKSFKDDLDSYVPSKAKVQELLEIVKENKYISYLYIKLYLESGLRGTEIDYFLHNYDLSKVEINESIVIYPIYYQRGNKNSYYMFISKKLFDDVINNLDSLKKFKSSNVKSLIKKKNLVSLKYLRKYQFTQMIKSGVSFEIANFIQGRASKNVGFNHYLAKKEIALREVRKYLKV